MPLVRCCSSCLYCANDTASQIAMLSAVAHAFGSQAAQAAALNAKNYTEMRAALNIHQDGGH